MPELLLRPDQAFDLDLTLSCGQVFRWERQGDWWRGVAGTHRVSVRQEGRLLTWNGASRRWLAGYFRLDEDLPAILRDIDRDPVVHEAIQKCRGLRLVRQPAWECLGSYICATYASIPVIKRRIALLCQCFGEQADQEGETFRTFPSLQALADADACRITECRLGYRAPYLHETARALAEDPGWEERIRSLPYGEARKELLRLKGVGDKVADCVLLFAFGMYEAFPVDVWIQRILRERYPGGAGLRTYNQMARFGRAHFGEYAGYAQEYLYCNRAGITGRERGRYVPESQDER